MLAPIPLLFEMAMVMLYALILLISVFFSVVVKSHGSIVS